MSEHATPEEKTEEPTDRRMQELRKEGQIPLSTDIVQVTGLIAGFLGLYICWGWMLAQMQFVIRSSFRAIAKGEPLTISAAQSKFYAVMLAMGPPVITILLLVATVTIFAVMLQTKWNVKQKWVSFKFSHLNPISGIKKTFSADGLMRTGKAIMKLLLILPLAYFALIDFAPDMVNLIHLSVEDILAFTGLGIWDLFWKICYILIVFAAIDFFWTRYQWLKQNRMTKQETKDERKSVEGDEATKRKIQSKGLQRIAQRIRESIPQADVVVTNPTHYAVALKYDRERMDAPTVIAKGRGFMALRIRELAKEAQVPVLERKWLARSLFASCEVGSIIPHELFRAVAEVLAYVYKLRGNRQQANRVLR